MNPQVFLFRCWMTQFISQKRLLINNTSVPIGDNLFTLPDIFMCKTSTMMRLEVGNK